MIIKAVLNPGEAVHTVEWYWHQGPSTPSPFHSVLGGEWLPKIETIDGDDVSKWALSDEQLESLQLACAHRYPLAEFLYDRASEP